MLGDAPTDALRDDRGAFAFTGGSMEIGYQLDPQVRMVAAMAHLLRKLNSLSLMA